MTHWNYTHGLERLKHLSVSLSRYVFYHQNECHMMMKRVKRGLIQPHWKILSYTSLITLSLITLSLITLSSIAQVTYAQSPNKTYEQRLDQLSLYIDRELYEQALIELEILSKTERGKTDVRIASAFAVAMYKTHQVTRALNYLRQARKLAQSEKERQQFNDIYQQWIKEYGLVRFESKTRLQEGKIDLTKKRNFLNSNRKAVFQKVKMRLHLGIQTPLSLYLPYGHYKANNTPFKIERNVPPPIVEVDLQMIAKKMKPTSKSHWLYIGIGSVAAIALGTGVYYLLQEKNPEPIGFQININR